MKWLAKLSKVKPVPLTASVGSLLLSGYFVTSGLGYLNATPLQAVNDAPQTPPKKAVDSAPRATTEEIARAILERNIFDSNVGSIAWEDRPAVVDEPDDEADEGGESEEVTEAPLTDCKSDLKLLASVVPSDPARGVAVIRRGSAASVQILVGTTVDNVKLLLLAPTHAYIRDGNNPVCKLPLFPSLTPAPPPPPVASEPKPSQAAPRSKRAPLFSEAELNAGIQEIGPDTYRVSRDMITRGMADAAAAVRGAKFQTQSGERNAGVKLENVPANSALSKLGMRQGDVLRTLNGVNLATPDGLLGAYTVLREQSKVTLQVMRDGRPKTLTYQFE